MSDDVYPKRKGVPARTIFTTIHVDFPQSSLSQWNNLYVSLGMSRWRYISRSEI